MPKKYDSFIDLGEPSGLDTPCKVSKNKKWYPTLRIQKEIKNKKIGQVGTALVKYKISSIQLQDNKKPSYTLDIQGLSIDEKETNKNHKAK